MKYMGRTTPESSPGYWLANARVHLQRMVAAEPHRSLAIECLENAKKALASRSPSEEVARLREALLRYGRHDVNCNFKNRVPFTEKARTEWLARGCTCGFDAALSTPTPTERECQ